MESGEICYVLCVLVVVCGEHAEDILHQKYDSPW